MVKSVVSLLVMNVVLQIIESYFILRLLKKWRIGTDIKFARAIELDIIELQLIDIDGYIVIRVSL